MTGGEIFIRKIACKLLFYTSALELLDSNFYGKENGNEY